MTIGSIGSGLMLAHNVNNSSNLISLSGVTLFGDEQTGNVFDSNWSNISVPIPSISKPGTDDWPNKD